ncbi:MAG TPA: hypothetical protein VLX09_10230 [Stellaceae bacterium]|nr:hypothetical protein [Stellaceae bacterium]
MSAFAVALIFFACTAVAALAGMILRANLPPHHLDTDSKDVLKLVMGLVATMSALVLSLLIASAQSSYNTQRDDLQRIAADVVELDRLLAHYGAEADSTRALLRQSLAAAHDAIFGANGVRAEGIDPQSMRGQSDKFYDLLMALSPKTDAQRFIQGRALQLSSSIAQMRLLIFERIGGSISPPFLVLLIFWISMLFMGFGLFARVHFTTLSGLFLGALSVSAAMFVILELNEPYGGLIRLSDAPFRQALSQVGQPAP